MAVLNRQQVQITGVSPTFVAASAGGDQIKAGDGVFLEYVNTDATDTTVTVVIPGTKYGQPLADVPVVVPATNGRRIIGPFPREIADETQLVSITYSKVTGLTVAALEV